MPSQMTWPPEGRNLDIFVAAAALTVLVVSRSRPPSKSLLWAFAILGLFSLANIGYTSTRSLAHQIRPLSFEPGLEVVATPPFIVLPGFLVQVALCCQLVLLRRLLRPTAPLMASDGGEDIEMLW